MFCDTHCHLFKQYYDDVLEVIDRAKKDNVNRMIVSGCDNISNLEILELIENDGIYGTLGIHPEVVDSYKEEDLKLIEENILNKKIVAVGEIGLDYHYTKENREKQIELFERQLEIAEKYNKPVVIHSRDATNDTIDILKKYKVKGVIHSFSGSLELANIYVKIGFLLGINGVVTFKNCRLKEVIKEIGVNNIVLETDAPYLTPVPFRGKLNDPSKIILIGEFVREIKEIELEELAKITNENIKRVFDI